MAAVLARTATRVAALVGTPLCALLFAGIALVSLPAALTTGDLVVIVGWFAQTFLQLVLLAVIQFGQNAASARSEQLIQETHDVVMGRLGSVHRTVAATHQHLTGAPEGAGRPRISGNSQAS